MSESRALRSDAELVERLRGHHHVVRSDPVARTIDVRPGGRDYAGLLHPRREERYLCVQIVRPMIDHLPADSIPALAGEGVPELPAARRQ